MGIPLGPRGQVEHEHARTALIAASAEPCRAVLEPPVLGPLDGCGATGDGRVAKACRALHAAVRH